MLAKSTVELLPSLNSDEGICNAARVSFAKTADAYTPEQNAKILRYLWKNKHWSPFGHARITFRLEARNDSIYNAMCNFFMYANLAGFAWQTTISRALLLQGSLWAWYENLRYMPSEHAQDIRRYLRDVYPACADMFKPGYVSDLVRPWDHNIFDVEHHAQFQTVSVRVTTSLFNARQLVKHQQQLCWNEESRRYIDSAVTFLDIEQFRQRPDGSIKQGSAADFDQKHNDIMRQTYARHMSISNMCYDSYLKLGMAPEQARAVLPVAAMTQWIWTGSVLAFHRVCKLRCDPHAQKEVRDVGEQLRAILDSQYPVTMAALDAEPEPELG